MDKNYIMFFTTSNGQTINEMAIGKYINERYKNRNFLPPKTAMKDQRHTQGERKQFKFTKS